MESGLKTAGAAYRYFVRFSPPSRLCYTVLMSYVEQSPEAERWAARLARWSGHLHAAHLAGLVEVLLDAAEPLGPLGAQVLWVAQPTLGLLVPRDEIAALARLLEAPAGVAWLRAQLLEPDEEAHL